jgi:hypothetical protein
VEILARGVLSLFSAKPINYEFPQLCWRCARTVHESHAFTAAGLALSEKQIPQIVENIGDQDREWRY